MIHKIHFSSELLLKCNEFIKLNKNTFVIYLDSPKSLNMAALLHQLHFSTIKANCVWILSDFTEMIL